MRWLDDTNDLFNVCLSKIQEIIKGRETCSARVHGVAKNQT